MGVATPNFNYTTTLASGDQTASGLFIPASYKLAGVILGDNVSGTQLYFNVSHNGAAYQPMISGGAWYSATVSAGWNVLDLDLFVAVPYVQFDMTGVTQSAQVPITAILWPF